MQIPFGGGTTAVVVAGGIVVVVVAVQGKVEVEVTGLLSPPMGL